MRFRNAAFSCRFFRARKVAILVWCAGVAKFGPALHIQGLPEQARLVLWSKNPSRYFAQELFENRSDGVDAVVLDVDQPTLQQQTWLKPVQMSIFWSEHDTPPTRKNTSIFTTLYPLYSGLLDTSTLQNLQRDTGTCTKIK
jgi:hypothetical protein